MDLTMNIQLRLFYFPSCFPNANMNTYFISTTQPYVCAIFKELVQAPSTSLPIQSPLENLGAPDAICMHITSFVPILGFVKLLSMSKDFYKLTFGMHTISSHLRWMDERYDSLPRLHGNTLQTPWLGIRGTQVKSSVRMEKTQETSKWLFLGNLIPEIESKALNQSSDITFE